MSLEPTTLGYWMQEIFQCYKGKTTTWSYYKSIFIHKTSYSTFTQHLVIQRHKIRNNCLISFLNNTDRDHRITESHNMLNWKRPTRRQSLCMWARWSALVTKVHCSAVLPCVFNQVFCPPLQSPCHCFSRTVQGCGLPHARLRMKSGRGQWPPQNFPLVPEMCRSFSFCVG